MQLGNCSSNATSDVRVRELLELPSYGCRWKRVRPKSTDSNGTRAVIRLMNFPRCINVSDFNVGCIFISGKSCLNAIVEIKPALLIQMQIALYISDMKLNVSFNALNYSSSEGAFHWVTGAMNICCHLLFQRLCNCFFIEVGQKGDCKFIKSLKMTYPF